VPEQAVPEQLQRLRARAEQALAQLQQGSDFAKTAAAFSDAPDALEGGGLGWRSASRLPSLFAETVATMKPGELSGVLRSAAGFHIIRLGDRRGGTVAGKPVQQTHVRHILIKTSELVSDTEAERKLIGLKERLDHGADFAELARLHSNDLSANKGGDLGWIFPGDTVPEFERAMDALPINGVSAPIHSPFGWHLVQVLERRVEDITKDRERQMARVALRERKSDEAYEDWLRQLRDRAYVEYRLEEK
jgi:peptidyl-prolyl cis-trans isomerase SurA